jgi:amidohydrolase
MSKNEVVLRVDGMADELYEMADRIHANPELGFQEHQASRLLSGYLEKSGFAISRGVAGLETAFVASYGESRDHGTVAFIAEMDALPVVGHGCGHNIIGPAAVGAAIAVADAAARLRGRVCVIATPAEEIPPPVKKRLLEMNVFKGVDVALITHGDDRTAVGGETLAMQALDIRFTGKAAHAAVSPDKGISALDAAVLTMHAIELLREHVRSDVRIHGTVVDGGGAPNVIPAHASLRYYARSLDGKYLEDVVERVRNCAKGAALAVGAGVEVVSLGVWDSRYNVPSLNATLLQNALENGAFAVEPASESAGTTDFGTVTRTLPAATLKVPLVERDVPGHSPEWALQAGGERGHRCLLLGAKAMAATAYDILASPELMTRIKDEFVRGR